MRRSKEFTKIAKLKADEGGEGGAVILAIQKMLHSLL